MVRYILSLVRKELKPAGIMGFFLSGWICMKFASGVALISTTEMFETFYSVGAIIYVSILLYLIRRVGILNIKKQQQRLIK
jgi:hypothetical protein